MNFSPRIHHYRGTQRYTRIVYNLKFFISTLTWRFSLLLFYAYKLLRSWWFIRRDCVRLGCFFFSQQRIKFVSALFLLRSFTKIPTKKYRDSFKYEDCAFSEEILKNNKNITISISNITSFFPLFKMKILYFIICKVWPKKFYMVTQVIPTQSNFIFKTLIWNFSVRFYCSYCPYIQYTCETVSVI